MDYSVVLIWVILFIAFVFVAMVLARCNDLSATVDKNYESAKLKSILGGVIIPRGTIERISRNYGKYQRQYIDLYNSEVVGNRAPRLPVALLQQIRNHLPYQEHSRLLRPQTHIGQRKLILSEIQFLTVTRSKYCIYAGAAPGHKTHYLSELFPDIKFILIDPNIFRLMLPDGTWHRDSNRLEIVQLLPFKVDAVTGVKTYLPLKYPTQSKVENLTVKRIIDGSEKIYIIEDYMTDDYAKMFKELGNDVTFISDIRSNVKNTDSSVEEEYPTNFDILWNTSMMFNWISVLQPKDSMLKFRPLYINDVVEEMRPELAFEESKKYGIDFVGEYKNGKRFKMPDGELFLQAWAGTTSSELRLWIPRANLANKATYKNYDSSTMETQLFYFNNIERGLCFHVNENASKRVKFCHCNDCALENLIWENYRKSINGHPQRVPARGVKEVIQYVMEIGYLTKRPLFDLHVNNIWDGTPDIISFEENVIIAEKRMEMIRAQKLVERRERPALVPHGDWGQLGEVLPVDEGKELVVAEKSLEELKQDAETAKAIFIEAENTMKALKEDRKAQVDFKKLEIKRAQQPRPPVRDARKEKAARDKEQEIINRATTAAKTSQEKLLQYYVLVEQAAKLNIKHIAPPAMPFKNIPAIGRLAQIAIENHQSARDIELAAGDIRTYANTVYSAILRTQEVKEAVTAAVNQHGRRPPAMLTASAAAEAAFCDAVYEAASERQVSIRDRLQEEAIRRINIDAAVAATAAPQQRLDEEAGFSAVSYKKPNSQNKRQNPRR